MQNRRDKKMIVRLSEAENEFIREKAENLGMTVSNYIRMRALLEDEPKIVTNGFIIPTDLVKRAIIKVKSCQDKGIKNSQLREEAEQELTALYELLIALS